MNLNRSLEKISNLNGENRLLKLAILIIGFACIISAYFSFYAVRYQKTVILPAAVDSRIIIRGNEISNDYIKLFTRYALNLVFTYTPASYPGQANDLLKLCTPEFYPVMQSKIYKVEHSVRKLGITSAYYPSILNIDNDKKEIVVSGLRFQSAHGREIENVMKKYLVKYTIIDGRFYLDGIQEITQ
ncbi:MAG: type IV conjugative transfer system protein TraE [Proteobacteria bacterium]|nr:type IV conjugative transfer system protein TraE [Pseudomonadota bacterium]